MIKNLTIVINSFIDNNIALEHLMNSLQINNNKFKTYNFIIVIGGYYGLENYKVIQENNITTIHANHNSIDFTGLITLLELYDNKISNYYLYLHDTCKVGDKFYEKIENINISNISSIKINKHYSMNIGIYSQKILNNFRLFLLNQKNTDPDKTFIFKKNGVQNEDYIFRNDKNNIVLNNFILPTKNIIGPIDYYKTGTLRIVEYYSNIDLYKIKSNWGQSNQYTLKL